MRQPLREDVAAHPRVFAGIIQKRQALDSVEQQGCLYLPMMIDSNLSEASMYIPTRSMVCAWDRSGAYFEGGPGAQKTLEFSGSGFRSR